jgi:hypothetical protein
MNAPRQPFDSLPPAQQAGILCNDPQFQRFAALRCGAPDLEFGASAAAQYLRDACQIDSRAKLQCDRDAATRFQNLRTEFDAWAGKIPNQR